MTDDDRKDTPWVRMIQQRQDRLEAILDEYTDRAVYLDVTPDMKRKVAREIVNLHRMISRYADESVVQDGDIPDIDAIKNRLGRETQALTESKRRGGGWEYETKPAVDELSFQDLLAMAEATESAAKKLGFWANVNVSPSGGSRLPHPNNLTADPASDGGQLPSREARQFESSHFFRSLYQDVEGDRGGGAIVIVDAEDARTGVGKTGAACAMAEFVAWYFGYEIQDRDGVLSGQEYVRLFQEHPNEEQVSVCVWDEAVGAGSGDARRSMSNENVTLGKAWQIMRDRRVITFVTLPDWGDLDSRLQKLADYRVWCRRSIGQMQAYEIGTTFQSGDIRTRGLGPGDGAEPIAFPDVTEDSTLYQSIKAKKNELQESDSLDATEMREAERQAEKEEQKPDLHDIADQVESEIDNYVSVHGGNKTEYIDSDLIQVDFELSTKKAKSVKKLLERRGVGP